MFETGVENLDVLNLPEDREREQYFFTKETIGELEKLCQGKTAFLCVPTVAEEAVKRGKELTVFDVDERLRDIFGDRFQYYDLARGLHSKRQTRTEELAKFKYIFETVMVDPPFSGVAPDRLAQNVDALLTWNEGGRAYIVYPRTGYERLNQEMARFGLAGEEEKVEIKYVSPPTIATRKGIGLYRFQRDLGQL